MGRRKKYKMTVNDSLLKKCKRLNNIESALVIMTMVHALLDTTPTEWKDNPYKLFIRISSNVWDVITLGGKFDNDVYCGMNVVIDHNRVNEMEISDRPTF